MGIDFGECKNVIFVVQISSIYVFLTKYFSWSRMNNHLDEVVADSEGEADVVVDHPEVVDRAVEEEAVAAAVAALILEVDAVDLEVEEVVVGEAGDVGTD